jgi:hypothetical protein
MTFAAISKIAPKTGNQVQAQRIRKYAHVALPVIVTSGKHTNY